MRLEEGFEWEAGLGLGLGLGVGMEVLMEGILALKTLLKGLIRLFIMGRLLTLIKDLLCLYNA